MADKRETADVTYLYTEADGHVSKTVHSRVIFGVKGSRKGRWVTTFGNRKIFLTSEDPPTIDTTPKSRQQKKET